MMEIDVQPRGSVEVVEVSGTGSVEGSASLRERFVQLLDAGESLFILDLTGGPALGSACLGELVVCREHVRKCEGVIKLVLNPGQHAVIEASRLDLLFETFEDVDAALDSFDAWTTTAGIP